VIRYPEGYLYTRTLTLDRPVILCGLGVVGGRVGIRGTAACWGRSSRWWSGSSVWLHRFGRLRTRTDHSAQMQDAFLKLASALIGLSFL
jgi:hypothetical protein